MLFKIMGIVCDMDCGTETQCEGREATMAQVTAQARQEGWAISSAGHYCPQHRGRARQPSRIVLYDKDGTAIHDASTPERVAEVEASVRITPEDVDKWAGIVNQNTRSIRSGRVVGEEPE
jgi:hypothetical protein